MSLLTAYFFLFWFVFSFCVFNLLHAFKSLALFPPSGKTVARYFGATSGLHFCSLSWNCFTKTSRSLNYVAVRCCFCYFGSPFAALTSALHNSAPPYANSPPNKKKKLTRKFRTPPLKKSELNLMPGKAGRSVKLGMLRANEAVRLDEILEPCSSGIA